MSGQALRWAVDETHLRGGTLRVVHAWSFPYHGGEIAHLVAESVHELLQKAAEQTVEMALDGVPDADPAVIECAIVKAPPAQALLDAARDAILLVVGSRGAGRLHKPAAGVGELRMRPARPVPRRDRTWVTPPGSAGPREGGSGAPPGKKPTVAAAPVAEPGPRVEGAHRAGRRA